MKLIGLMSTAVLSLTLVAAAPVYAQEQRDQQEEKKAKPAHEEKGAQHQEKAKQEEKSAEQREKNTKHEESNSAQHEQQAKRESAPQRGSGGRIPDDRYRANFGREHRFRVSQADYSRDRRFQYGGYWFVFVDPWPSNWLYTQDVFVADINGVYYLCNPMYPGVNIALSFTL